MNECLKFVIIFLRSTFAFDVLCTVPFYLLDSQTLAIKLLRIFKIGRLKAVSDMIFAKVFLVVVANYLKILCKSCLTSYREGNYISSTIRFAKQLIGNRFVPWQQLACSFLFFIRLLFVLAWCSHFLNCLWIIIGHYTQETYDRSWIQLYELSTTSNYDIYLQGLIFITTTITTIGFSNYNTFSNLESFFVIFVEVHFDTNKLAV